MVVFMSSAVHTVVQSSKWDIRRLDVQLAGQQSLTYVTPMSKVACSFTQTVCLYSLSCLLPTFITSKVLLS